MCSALDCSENELKRKITNLRTSLQRELRKIADSKNTGTEADDIYVSKWQWFASLQFLAPICAAYSEPTTSSLGYQNDSVDLAKQSDVSKIILYDI